MRAYQIESFGGIDAIQEKDIPQPVPQAGEVLVKIHSTAVNPVDFKIAEGHLQELLPHQLPITLGWDVAGTIAAVGAGAEKFKVGDEIFAYGRKDFVRDGSFAEYIALAATSVAAKPQNIDFNEAAAIPLTGLTAWQALYEFAGLQAGQTVLIHAGAGGVGSLAIQFAKNSGATVLTTASYKNLNYVKELGADICIDYQEEDFVSVVKKNFPSGVDVVFDCAGGDTLTRSFAAVKTGGALVSIVGPPDEAAAKHHQIKAGFIFVRPEGSQLAEIGQLISRGRVQMPFIQLMNLGDVKEALRLSKSGRTRGKIVLRVQA